MKRLLVAPLFILMGTFLTADDKPAGAGAGPASVAPPVAKKIHTENHINGGNLVDDYSWMRDKANPEVAQYLEAENAYADSVMKPTEALQQKLYEEMVSHIKETDVNVPYRQGGYFYNSRWEKGKHRRTTRDIPECSRTATLSRTIGPTRGGTFGMKGARR